MNESKKADSRKAVEKFLRYCNNGRGIQNGGTIDINNITIEIHGKNSFNDQVIQIQHVGSVNCYKVILMDDYLSKALNDNAVFWSEYIEFDYNNRSNILGFMVDDLKVFIMKAYLD